MLTAARKQADVSNYDDNTGIHVMQLSADESVTQLTRDRTAGISSHVEFSPDIC